ncbi:MAG: IclR family transcriptional regulator C-terminal domain-containing protein [Anaerolineales bacterium]
MGLYSPNTGSFHPTHFTTSARWCNITTGTNSGGRSPPYTQHSIVNREDFFQALRRIHERGFAISKQEFEEGINAVAAPILNQNNDPIASIAIAGPSYRLTKDLMLEIGPVLQKTAGDIAQEVKFVTNNF